MIPSSTNPVTTPPMHVFMAIGNDEAPPYSTFEKAALGIGCGLVGTGALLCALSSSTKILCVAGTGTIALGLSSCGAGAASRFKKEGD